VNFPAFSGSAATRDMIIAQVRAYYSMFNVDIVTTRPTSGGYSMTMIGGRASSVGLSGTGAAGVAPLDCGDTNESDISFAFADEMFGNDVHTVSVTVAQESAHGFGLGHTSDVTDIMYPALSGRESAFQDKEMMIYDIGGGGSSDCSGTGMQNSYRLLLSTVGMHGSATPDTTPPDISFTEPQDGATVPAGFRIGFNATDNRGVTTVEIYADGQKIGALTQAPWSIDVAPGTFPAGKYKLKGLAKDAAGNQKESAEITVTVKALGETPGDLGSACTGNGAECSGGGFCAFDSGANRHFCTRFCDNQNTCPSGFACVDAGGPKVCASMGSMGMNNSGGGCAIASAASRSGLGWLGLAAVAALVARSRRRRVKR
jgi:MYXO-CTERM domain-containing protein